MNNNNNITIIKSNIMIMMYLL